MKKQVSIFASCILAILLLAACSTSSSPSTSPSTDSNEAIEIKEHMFVAQTNEIYLNSEDYIGKSLQYEGMFHSYQYIGSDETFCSVFRYGPGCCGNDGEVGFEIIWDGTLPNENDWVEVVGILESYEYGDTDYLRIRASALTTLETRGAETVAQ